jgi:hypothetical protein
MGGTGNQERVKPCKIQRPGTIDSKRKKMPYHLPLWLHRQECESLHIVGVRMKERIPANSISADAGNPRSQKILEYSQDFSPLREVTCTLHRRLASEKDLISSPSVPPGCHLEK